MCVQVVFCWTLARTQRRACDSGDERCTGCERPATHVENKECLTPDPRPDGAGQTQTPGVGPQILRRRAHDQETESGREV